MRLVKTVNKNMLIRSKKHMKMSKGDRAFNYINVTIMVFVLIITAYPLYYCFILSLNDGRDAIKGGIVFWPRIFTLDNYKAVFEDAKVFGAYAVSIARTVVGTFAGLLFNALFSYGLSKKELALRKVYMTICIITMYFAGGMIPLYFLISALGLLNSFWVYIIPKLSSFSTVLIFMSFFKELPASIEESALIDGATPYGVFLKIVLPLSKPVLATMALFIGVDHWNSWFDGYIYMDGDHLLTLQTYLVQLINQAEAQELLRRTGQAGVSGQGVGLTTDSLKIATMFVVIVPVMLVYPFLQKHFTQGILLGGIKG